MNRVFLNEPARFDETKRSFAASQDILRHSPQNGRVFSTNDVESISMKNEDAIRSRFLAARDHLDERGRRVFVAAEALAPDSGGIAAVSRATGVARSTIGRGIKDLQNPSALTGRVRRTGGGPPFLEEVFPTLLHDLRLLVEPATMGDPMHPLMWVSKSLVKLSAALLAIGHKISPNSVARLLEEIGYRRRVNQKTREGSGHPDRDAQFEHINDAAIRFQVGGQPVISVDTQRPHRY